MVLVFSVSAFFIVLREVLEACLVVGIALAYLNRVGATQFKRSVWFGVIVGVIVSILVGLIFAVIFHLTGQQWFANIEAQFEGILFLFAAFLITWLVIWMMIMGKEIRLRMEDQIDEIIENEFRSPFRRKLSIFILIFIQVLREGIETVIFLIGSANADDVGGWEAIPLSGILAIAIGIVLSFLVFKGLVKLDLLKLLNISSVLLICFAAGLTSIGFHELQEAGWLGTWQPKEKRQWWNVSMWSMETCCDAKENSFFGMLRAVFGYQHNPTFIEFSTYFVYWFLVSVIGIVINWRIIRSHNSKILSLSHNMILWSCLFSFVAFIYAIINPSWTSLSSTIPALVLSVVSFITFCDAPYRLTRIKLSFRPYIAFGCGGFWVALTIYTIILHVVEMDCESKGSGCSLDKFFFFGLIFSADFNEMGRQSNSWPGIAVLAGSLVVSTFFFAFLSFLIIVSSFNFHESGIYMDDDAIQRSEMIDGRLAHRKSRNRISV